MDPLGRLRYLWRHPANRGRRLRALARAALWQAHKRLLGRPWDVRLPGGRVLRGYPHVHSTGLLVYAGLYDWAEMRFLLRYLRPGDNFLDVGGNVGVYALLASAALGEKGEIHVFEPAPESLLILEENLRLNRLDNARIHPLAAGEAEGEVRLTQGLESMNRVVGSGGGEASAQVRQVRLDDEVGDIPFALGKMDIEGAELPALRGAARMLAARNPPVWILEVGEAGRAFGYGPGDLAAHLREAGYGLAGYDPEANRLGWAPEAWRASQNVLAIAQDRMKEVEKRLRG